MFNSPVFKPELLGTGKASAFPGFCSRHDTALFSDIEREVLKPTVRQLTLIAYRMLCHELVAKRGQLRMSVRDAELNPDNRVAH
ncbi:MAG: hypothetical protein AAFS11_08680, partial [Planctomycetota bacterium]